MAARTCLIVLTIGVATLDSVKGSHATECSKFGQPSYSASRQEAAGPVRISAKVFVQGNKERVEYFLKGDKQVRIINETEIILLNATRNTGISMKLPDAEKRPKKIDFRTVETEQGFVITAPSPKGNKTVKYETVCRKDGVTLARWFPIFVKGKAVQASYTQSDIRLAPIDPAMFAMPEGVKLKRR